MSLGTHMAALEKCAPVTSRANASTVTLKTCGRGVTGTTTCAATVSTCWANRHLNGTMASTWRRNASAFGTSLHRGKILSTFEIFIGRRYYFMPELWYRISAPEMRFVRIGDHSIEAPGKWRFDRVRRLVPGLWRNVDELRHVHHLLFRRLGE